MRPYAVPRDLYLKATDPAENASMPDVKDRFLTNGGQWRPTAVLEELLRDAALGKLKCHRV